METGLKPSSSTGQREATRIADRQSVFNEHPRLIKVFETSSRRRQAPTFIEVSSDTGFCRLCHVSHRGQALTRCREKGHC